MNEITLESSSLQWLGWELCSKETHTSQYQWAILLCLVSRLIVLVQLWKAASMVQAIPRAWKMKIRNLTESLNSSPCHTCLSQIRTLMFGLAKPNLVPITIMASQATMRAQAAMQAVRYTPCGLHRSLPVPILDLAFQGHHTPQQALRQGTQISRQQRRVISRASSNGSGTSTSGLAIDLSGAYLHLVQLHFQ